MLKQLMDEKASVT